MILLFTVLLLLLLAAGLPVAFSLGMGGLFGMFVFMDGASAFTQIPILAYKALDDFVLLLLAAGLPVAFSLGMGGLFGMFVFMDGASAFTQIPILAYKALDDFVLTAVPLYVLMSQILLVGHVGDDLFELGNKWLKHYPGGLGIATI